MTRPADEPSAREQRVNEATAADLEAADAGRAPEPRAFLEGHPDLAPELEAFLADRERFARLAQPLGPAASPRPKKVPAAEAPTLAPGETAGPAPGTKVRY